MTLKSRLQKLSTKFNSEKVTIYCIGWATTTWSKSEELVRHKGEEKDEFFERVYQTSKKECIWFD